MFSRPIIESNVECYACQKYCRILHSAILSTCTKLPPAFKTFVLSIFEWLLKTGYTPLWLMRNPEMLHWRFGVVNPQRSLIKYIFSLHYGLNVAGMRKFRTLWNLLFFEWIVMNIAMNIMNEFTNIKSYNHAIECKYPCAERSVLTSLCSDD